MIYISNTMGKGEISFESKDFDRIWDLLQIIRVFWCPVVPFSRAIGTKMQSGKEISIKFALFVQRNYYFSPSKLLLFSHFFRKNYYFSPAFLLHFSHFFRKNYYFSPTFVVFLFYNTFIYKWLQTQFFVRINYI